MEYREDLRDIKQSLQRLEDKIDRFGEGTSTNATDIGWIKGFIKTSTSLLVTILGAIVTYLISIKGE